MKNLFRSPDVNHDAAEREGDALCLAERGHVRVDQRRAVAEAGVVELGLLDGSCGEGRVELEGVQS